LGKVRPEHVKKIARELLERYPDRFTTNFEENKKTLKLVANIYSARLRNRIAGYVTRLVAISQPTSTEESTEEVSISEEV